MPDDVLRIPKLAVRKGLQRLAGGFNHSLAQWYERASNRGTMRRAFLDVYGAITDNKRRGGLWHDANDQWFCGDQALFARFVEHVRLHRRRRRAPEHDHSKPAFEALLAGLGFDLLKRGAALRVASFVEYVYIAVKR